MKILHVIPTLSSLAGGPTEVAINLVKELNELGAQAEILTTDDNGNSRLDVPFGDVTVFRDVPVRFFPRINPRLKEFIISPAAVRWMNANLHHYDILDIHYLFSFVPLMARTMARRGKLPYTVRTMGQLSPWALQQSSLKKKIFFKIQEFKNLEKANALHSTSRLEEEDIRAFGLKTPVINIPLGVQRPALLKDASLTIRQRYNIPKDSFILLFLSRLHYKKRPDLVIEIASKLKSTHPVHVIMAGAGEPEYENTLRTLAKNLGLADSISFAGFVEGVEKNELLQGSDLFVLPSFSENFGIAVAESLAAGTPVVITPEVQISEYVESYRAGIITKGDVNSFLSAVAKCIESKELMNGFRLNGLKLAEDRFNWKVIAKELLSNYEKILNGAVR